MTEIMILSPVGIKGKSSIKLDYIENVEDQSKVIDTIVDSWKLNDTTEIDVFRCNITSQFVMANTRIPCMYVSAYHISSIRMVSLYSFFIYFKITKLPETAKDLINHELEGEFETELKINENVKKLNSIITKFPGEKKVVKIFKKLTELPEMKQQIKTILEERREKLDDVMNFSGKIPKVTLSLVNLCDKDDKEISELIN